MSFQSKEREDRFLKRSCSEQILPFSTVIFYAISCYPNGGMQDINSNGLFVFRDMEKVPSAFLGKKK